MIILIRILISILRNFQDIVTSEELDSIQSDANIWYTEIITDPEAQGYNKTLAEIKLKSNVWYVKLGILLFAPFIKKKYTDLMNPKDDKDIYEQIKNLDL